MTEALAPDNLFEALINGGKGTIHLDGLTVKKRLFDDCGHFFERLRLHQDTALAVQMSACGKLIAGRLDIPVAMRTIHDQNRILNQHDKRYNKYLYWQTLFNWALEKNLPTGRLIMLFHKYIRAMYALARHNPSLFPRNFQGLKPLWTVPLKHPFFSLAAASRAILTRPAG